MTGSDPQPAVPAAAPAPAADVLGTVEHLFRHESAKMVAILTRIFGVEHLTLAEDVVQDTLARALQTWPFHGIPDNPSAWIMRAARNRALDVVRREQNFREKEAEIVRVLDRPPAPPEAADPLESEITDDCLRMMFVCCHPQIPPEAQVALALKTLCGFSVTEIASALLTSDAAIAKRLTRAKQQIRDSAIPFEIPESHELAARLDGVLRALYLLFNEGYKASTGERLVREELCHEAIRLGLLLTRQPATAQPRTHALLALMLLNAARLPARTDGEGNLLLLQQQDRSRWTPGLIHHGIYQLGLSASGDALSEYHLEAGIAACHSTAPNDGATDWPRILKLYDQLVALTQSPIAALNRAVAVARVCGPQAGLDSLEGLTARHSLDGYHLLHAVRGTLHTELGNWHEAQTHLERALACAALPSEREFLSRRIRECEQRAG